MRATDTIADVWMYLNTQTGVVGPMSLSSDLKTSPTGFSPHDKESSRLQMNRGDQEVRRKFHTGYPDHTGLTEMGYCRTSWSSDSKTSPSRFSPHNKESLQMNKGCQMRGKAHLGLPGHAGLTGMGTSVSSNSKTSPTRFSPHDKESLQMNRGGQLQGGRGKFHSGLPGHTGLTGTGYQLKSGVTGKTYSDLTATLLECGLTPNATLHICKASDHTPLMAAACRGSETLPGEFNDKTEVDGRTPR